MIEIGRLCVKLAGRDSGRKCVIVDIIDDNFAVIDGDVRRKRCNILHLEPLNQKLDISKNASHHEVVSEFKKLGIELKEKKPRQKKARQLRMRKSKLAKTQKKEQTETSEGKAKKVKKEKNE